MISYQLPEGRVQREDTMGITNGLHYKPLRATIETNTKSLTEYLNKEIGYSVVNLACFVFSSLIKTYSNIPKGEAPMVSL